IRCGGHFPGSTVLHRAPEPRTENREPGSEDRAGRRDQLGPRPSAELAKPRTGPRPGALFTGDTIQVIPDQGWVSFMYSYPNLIPLSAAAVRRIVDAVEPFEFERLYGGWWKRVVPE